MQAFEVSKKGLEKIQARKGKKFIPLELVQNALDEHGVTRIDVRIQASTQHRGYYTIRVEDDAPEGFHDLSHAYTLFAESRKKGNPEQRGRWNLGEKLVIASCRYAEIKTTKGTVTFADDERSHSRTKTGSGSIFFGEVRMTHLEADEAIRATRSVLVPKGIELTLNGEAVDCRSPIAEDHTIVLPTEVADDEGFLRRSKRKTSLLVFEPSEGEVPHLYEMGIPVVELDCAWHVDIGQKIPLNMDRDNVTPAYLRKVLTAVANLMHKELNEESAAQPWVGEALKSPDIEPAAVRSIVTTRHGKDAVAYDPSDPEGSKIAMSQGRQVVYGGSYSSEQWENIRGASALPAAGQVTPSPKPFHPDGEPLKVLDRSEWNEFHVDFEDYVQRVSRALIGREVELTLANDRGWGFGGAYGRGRLTVNIVNRDHWFKSRPSQVECLPEIDRLLIHELAHDKVSDHLSNAFHEECCRLGAKMVQAVREGKLL